MGESEVCLRIWFQATNRLVMEKLRQLQLLPIVTLLRLSMIEEVEIVHGNWLPKLPSPGQLISSSIPW